MGLGSGPKVRNGFAGAERGCGTKGTGSPSSVPKVREFRTLGGHSDGCRYTDTRIGTFGFQQLIYYPISIIWSVTMMPFSFLGLFLLGPGLLGNLIATISLWVLFFISQHFKKQKMRGLSTDIHYLAAGIYRASDMGATRNITWRGIPRRPRNRLRSRILQSFSNFLINSLFRRVVPAEKWLQAMCQHIFSLAAILLVFTRVLVGQRMALDDLPSRTTVKLCNLSMLYPEPDGYLGRYSPTTLYVRAPPNAEIIYNSTLNNSIPLHLTVNISRIHQTDASSLVVTPCGQRKKSTSSKANDTQDSFHVYECPGDYMGFLYESRIGFEYTIGRYPLTEEESTTPARNLSIHNLVNDRMPSLWIVDSLTLDRHGDKITHLTHPIFPEAEWHIVSKTYWAAKKFITSHLLQDAILGSDPTYDTVPYFETEILRREPMRPNLTDSNPGVTVIATGMIYNPEFLKYSEQIPFAIFNRSQSEPSGLCKITEEHRMTSGFDFLASIGGLLALLQGIHVLVFGRPLFWGMFGAKLITPFGLVGKLATQAFRERLQQQYHRRTEPQDSTKTTQESGTEESGSRVEIDMTRFLLDYVIDMGPASLPSPPQEKQNSETDSSDSEDEVSYQRVRGLGKEDGVEATKLEWESGTIEPAKSENQV